MADVNVEFGAKDTGLEATLKTVQEQMTKLESEVKSGTLSFEELSQKMRQLSQAERINEKLRDIGDASAEARPKVDSLGNTVLDAGQKSNQSAGLFDASFQKIAAAFTVGNLAAEGFQKVVEIAFTAAQKVVQGFSDALDLGGRLNELSARTGEAAGTLLVLETAFKNSGLQAEQVGQTINKLQNFMAEAADGGERQTAVMNRLGISLSELNGKTPTEQMAIFAKRISEIEDPTQRAAAASDIFGEKIGGKLLPLLTEFSPSLEDAREKVGSLEQVMNENASTFDAAGETIDAVNGKFMAFAAGILSETIPALEALGESFANADAAELGRELGEVLNPALQATTEAVLETLKEYREFATATNAAAMGNYELANAGGKATGMFDLLKVMTNSVLGPLGDLIGGTDTYTSAANLAAEAAKNGAASIGETNTQIQNTGTSIESTLPLIGEFNANLKETKPSFTGLGEQTTLVKDDFSQMADFSAQLVGLTNEQVKSLGGVVEQTQISKQLNEEILPNVERVNQLLEEREAKEAERNAKLQEQLQLDLQIAEAKASGNTSLLQSLEYQKTFNQELQKAINAGMGEPEARAFAKAMSDAKTASGGTAKDVQEIKTFVDLIKESKPEKPIESLREKSAKAREEIEAFGEYIGIDLSRMSMPDVAKKLGVDTLGQDGSEQIDTILNHIKAKMPDAKINPVDEDAGKASADEIAGEIDTKLGEQQYSVDVKPEVDQAQLDAQIADMNAEITNHFTGGQGGPGGEGGQGGQGGRGGDAIADISSLVTFLQPWTQIITAIRDRLPMQALAY